MTIKKDKNGLSEKLLDELMQTYQKPEDLLGKNGLLKQLTKALVERAMQGEITQHLGYEKHSVTGNKSGNSRNGTSNKTIRNDYGNFPIEIPRDRNGTFEPQIIPKGQTRFDGFDDKIISMYARGMTTRDIQAHLQDIYNVEVSPTLISNVTNEVINEVKIWQNRPLDAIYPIVYLDALRVKSRIDGQIKNQAVYLAIGINMDGLKEVLGMWIAKTEGAKFWLSVITEIKNRGVQDIFIACVDGLKGFPEAIETVFPETQVQLCIVHMVRNSLKYVPYKEKKKVATDLRQIYSAATVDAAYLALETFAENWDSKYPTISRSWIANWENLTPFFNYPPEIRKVIYTTNAIESLNYSLRKVTKTSGSFPTNDAVFKLLFLALRNVSKKWTMPIRYWKKALNHFVIMFEDRIEAVK
jgi:putative transposase